jgi:hypothetical protein
MKFTPHYVGQPRLEKVAIELTQHEAEMIVSGINQLEKRNGESLAGSWQTLDTFRLNLRNILGMLLLLILPLQGCLPLAPTGPEETRVVCTESRLVCDPAKGLDDPNRCYYDTRRQCKIILPGGPVK